MNILYQSVLKSISEMKFIRYTVSTIRSMVSRKVFFVFFLVTVNSFLLDTSQKIGNHSQLSSGPYLTETKFLEEKKLLKQEVNILRHDVNQNFDALASQLQQKFETLEHLIPDNRTLNETERKYEDLVQMFSLLNTEINELKRSYNRVTKESNDLREELNNLRNASNKRDFEIHALKQLDSIKPLHDIDLLKQNITHLGLLYNELNMKEIARSQDFMALYNLSMESKKEIALTAYYTPHRSTVPANTAIAFNDVRFSVGFKSLDSFKNTGKLVCEHSGLYSISVSLMSPTSDGEFDLMLNDKPIAHADVGGDNWHSATAVVAAHLYVNDAVWLRPNSALHLWGLNSCYFSVIKIK